MCSSADGITYRARRLSPLRLIELHPGVSIESVRAKTAAVIRCTTAQVEDIVYFYTMFYTKPMGKHIVMVCRTLSCALAGAERVTEALVAELGLKPGETDANREFSLLEVECLGACDRAPVRGWRWSSSRRSPDRALRRASSDAC